MGTLKNTFNKFAVLLRMLWGPLKIPSKNRCAVTYAVGTLQNTFKKFAVLLRMQWGPLKMPSTNSLCCYVCCGDPSKCLQKIRCAVTYAVGTLQKAFKKFAVLLRMQWGPLKMPLTMCCYFACKITCLINCNQSRKIHAPNLNPNSYQPLAVRMR